MWMAEWKHQHAALLEQLPEESSRAFWGLLAFGSTGSGSAYELFQLFSFWGVIHLLVLSGSQINHFANVLRSIIRLLTPRWTGTPFHAFFEGSCLFFVLGFYVVEAGFPEPLVRAFICFGLARCLPFANPGFRIGLAFVVHVACFIEQTTSLSFILSWVSYLLLVLAGRIGLSHLGTLIVLSICCQFLVIFYRGLPALSALEWLQVVMGNLAMVGVFEMIVFPMVAVSLVFSLLLWLLPENSWLGSGLEEIFCLISGLYCALGQGLLGSLKSIRYIVEI